MCQVDIKPRLRSEDAVERARGQFPALSELIQVCESVRTRAAFCADVLPRLQALLPHDLLSCVVVRLSDATTQAVSTVKAWEGVEVGTLSVGRPVSCPAILSWLQMRQPVCVQGEPWHRPHVAVHGVVEPGQENACCFVLNGLRAWTEWESYLLRFMLPHLHQALCMASDFWPKVNHSLTGRETEVLQWVCKGKSNPEIATILGLSPWTIKIHVCSVLAKLNAANRGHAVAKAVSLGLVSA